MKEFEIQKGYETPFRVESFLPSEQREWILQREKAEQGVILLAEDREDEVMLLRRAFAEAGFLNPLQVVPNGEEAIHYLEGEGKFANRHEYPLPALVLLDLKMPRKDGFEVLQWIRQQPGLSTLRVVVLTASDAIRDVNRAYQLGANSFLVKPVDFPHFVEMTQALKGHWIWTSEEPETARPSPATVAEAANVDHGSMLSRPSFAEMLNAEG